jgi:thiamine biosynthesis protein ThiS
MIKVNNKDIKYKEGMTLIKAIDESGEVIDQYTLIMLNGKIIDKDELDEKYVSDKSEIKVLKVTDGG